MSPTWKKKCYLTLAMSHACHRYNTLVNYWQVQTDFQQNILLVKNRHLSFIIFIFPSDNTKNWQNLFCYFYFTYMRQQTNFFIASAISQKPSSGSIEQRIYLECPHRIPSGFCMAKTRITWTWSTTCHWSQTMQACLMQLLHYGCLKISPLYFEWVCF